MPAPLDYASPPVSPASDRRGPQYVLAFTANLCGLGFAVWMAYAAGRSQPWALAWLPVWVVTVAGSVVQIGLTVWAATVSVELHRPSRFDPLVWVAWLATAGYLVALPLALVATSAR
jgi:hypothetical protein